jgi:Zn-dependent protease
MLLSLLFSQPLLFTALLLGIVVALTFHEFSHGFVAKLLGDPTAERMGRLTLNPMVHLDPLGFIMLLVAGFGFAKPVPYNPAYLRNKRTGPLLIGLAGPASNILLSAVCVVVLKMLYPSLGAANLLIQFLLFSAYININLAIFNLIPIPPLDGSKVLFAALHGPQWGRLRYSLETRGPLILIGLIIVDSVSGVGIFSGLFQFFGDLFFGLLGIRL